MTINEKQDEIIEEFEFLEDWIERYQLIIDYGKQLKPMPESDKTPQNLIDGCQSSVWQQRSGSNGEADEAIRAGVSGEISLRQSVRRIARHIFSHRRYDARGCRTVRALSVAER